MSNVVNCFLRKITGSGIKLYFLGFNLRATQAQVYDLFLHLPQYILYHEIILKLCRKELSLISFYCT